MPKVIVMNASPRPKGFGQQTLAEVIRGIESAGSTVSFYDLNNPGIRPCQGCRRCSRYEGCSQRDYLSPMYEDIKHADAIVISAPIYFAQPCAQAKVWLDRMIPLLHGDFNPRYPGKKFVTVYPVGDTDLTDYQDQMDYFDFLLTFFGWEKLDQIVVAGTWEVADYTIPDEILKRAYEDGVKLGEFRAPEVPDKIVEGEPLKPGAAPKKQ